MKNIYITFILILGLAIFTSCKKEIQKDANQKTINATIQKNEAFQYEFGLIGIEDNIFINQQAKSFETSELNRDANGKMIYTYKPGLNYAGTDEVEISLGISNGGAIVNTLKTKFKILIRN